MNVVVCSAVGWLFGSDPASPTAAAEAAADSATAVTWFGTPPTITALAGLALLGLVAWLALIVAQRLIVPMLAALTERTPAGWDEILFDRVVFHRLSWAVPLLLIAQGLPLVPNLSTDLEQFLGRFVSASLILVMLRAFAAFLAAVNELYSRLPRAKERPIKGYLQVVSIIAHLAGIILIVATLMQKDPLFFFSGLGAMTAVLLLVFRDSLLSLVAGIQITSNDLIRVGDWIEMPQFNADGDVIDIALNSVRVQNWDKTITVIPTHKFLENSFKNWRGMHESGGRRIKRAVHIDIGTIRFLTDEEIERFGRFVLLEEYIARKKAELEEYNRIHCPDPSFVANARRLTNVGTLRAYIINYLRQHPGINKDLTFLVRQLPPGPEGLPIKIYVFTSDTRWAVYEGIQADIFDHILAIVPEFGLRVYQKPAGSDVAALGRALDVERLQPA